MQVKRIVAGDMRRALQIVREKLGPDAIILSNKRTPNGVEILCTLDDEALESSPLPAAANAREFSRHESSPEQTPYAARTASKYQEDIFARDPDRDAGAVRDTSPPPTKGHDRKSHDRMQAVAGTADMQTAFSTPNATESNSLRNSLRASVPASARADAATMQPYATSETKSSDDVEALKKALATNAYLQTAQRESIEQLGAIRSELDQMREWLEAQIGTMSFGNLKNRSPVKAALWKRFSRLGLSSSVLHDLLDEFPDDIGKEDAWLQSLSELAGRIPVCHHDICAGGGIHAFVGPAGAGKTTTIGKLAARHVLQYGKDSIGLVSMDNQRIGGHEQLRIYARLLDIPLKIVANFGDLQQALMAFRDKSLVLIDTAGLNANSEALADQLEILASSASIQCHLVIDTTAQYSSMVASCVAYQDADIRHCVLTKLDETISLGEAISVLIEQQIPVAYVSNGQSVPDNLSWIKPRVLISQSVKLSRLTADDEDQTIINFSQQRRAVDEPVH